MSIIVVVVLVRGMSAVAGHLCRILLDRLACFADGLPKSMCGCLKWRE